jgi:drug/metabolite transporter (DMT)-like permease
MNPAGGKPPIHPILAVCFAILAVSTASIFIRFAQPFTAALVIAAWRLVLAATLLAPLAFLRHTGELRSLGRGDLGLALLSGLFLALHFATWITSLEYTTVASSVVLVSTVPLWVALLSPFTLKEPLTGGVMIGIFLTLVGSAIVGLSDVCTTTSTGLACPPLADFVHGKAFLGDMLALTGGIMAAGYLLVGRRLRSQFSLVPYVFVVYGMAGAVMLVAILGTGEKLVGFPPQAYVWLILLALVPQLIGHSTFNWSLRYLSAAYVSITLLGEPIGSTILAYILLSETPTILKLFGAILILAGIYLASRSAAGQPASGAVVLENS